MNQWRAVLALMVAVIVVCQFVVLWEWRVHWGAYLGLLALSAYAMKGVLS